MATLQPQLVTSQNCAASSYVTFIKHAPLNRDTNAETYYTARSSDQFEVTTIVKKPKWEGSITCKTCNAAIRDDTAKPEGAASMAIPIRATITCPTCGTSENETYGDVSVGPQDQTSDLPRYSMFTNPLWTQTHRDGETYLSCTTCGETEFDTLALLAVHRGRPKQDPKT